MAKTKGFAVGTLVAIKEELVWCWGAAANKIAEVTDCRVMNGLYLYTLRSEANGHILARDVPGDDLIRVAANEVRG